jgi:hypothetical protein
MRSRLLLGLIFALTSFHDRAFGGPQPALDGAPPKRSKVSCAKLRQQLEKSNRELGVVDKIEPRSWGSLPVYLRKLPPGAELCGVEVGLGQAVITSPLFGKDLESHYAPLFAKLGCEPLDCRVVATSEGVPEQTRCRCAMPGVAGVVITDSKHEAFTLALTK